MTSDLMVLVMEGAILMQHSVQCVQKFLPVFKHSIQTKGLIPFEFESYMYEIL